MFDLPGDVRGPLDVDVEANSDLTASDQTLQDVTGHADVVLQNVMSAVTCWIRQINSSIC